MTTTSYRILWGVICCVLCFPAGVSAEESGSEPEAAETEAGASPERAADGESGEGEEVEEPEEAEEATSEEPSDEEQIARARELFTQGVDLSDREQWAAASLRFEEALELHDAPSIRFNLAASYSQVGRRVEAAEQVDLVLADPTTPEELATRARALLTELEPLLGSITISTSALPENAEILLDGHAVLADRLASSIRLEPGPHMVTATVDSREIAHQDVQLQGGQSIDVELTPTEPIEEPVDEDEDRTPLYRDWRLWVGVGAGIVVLTVAIAVGVSAGAGAEVEDPIPGNMNPGVLYWR